MIHWLSRYILFGPYLRFKVRAKVIGKENLPRSGPFLIALGSHKSEVESGVLSVYLRRIVIHFLAKAEYWQGKRILGWYMTKIGQIPVDRSSREKSDEAIEAGAQLLRDGKVLAIYPEATRSPDEFVHAGYPSFVDMIVRSGSNDVPIIPIGLVGFEQFMDDGIVPKHRGRVKIVIGQPILLSDAEQLTVRKIRDTESAIRRAQVALSKERGKVKRAKLKGEISILERQRIVTLGPVARRVTERTMKAIARLCGKPYSPKRITLKK